MTSFVNDIDATLAKGVSEMSLSENNNNKANDDKENSSNFNRFVN